MGLNEPPSHLAPSALCRFVQLLSTSTRLERFLRLGDVNDRTADEEEDQNQGQGSQGQPKQEEQQEQQGQVEQQEEQAATE